MKHILMHSSYHASYLFFAISFHRWQQHYTSRKSVANQEDVSIPPPPSVTKDITGYLLKSSDASFYARYGPEYPVSGLIRTRATKSLYHSGKLYPHRFRLR